MTRDAIDDIRDFNDLHAGRALRDSAAELVEAIRAALTDWDAEVAYEGDPDVRPCGTHIVRTVRPHKDIVDVWIGRDVDLLIGRVTFEAHGAEWTAQLIAYAGDMAVYRITPTEGNS